MTIYCLFFLLFFDSPLKGPYSNFHKVKCKNRLKDSQCWTRTDERAIRKTERGTDTLHSDSKHPGFATWVLGHMLIRSLNRLHHSLIRSLRTARFASVLRCPHSFIRSLTHELPSWERVSGEIRGSGDPSRITFLEIKRKLHLYLWIFHVYIINAITNRFVYRFSLILL